mmetsp:Transcript_27312/g.51773  ORF Transcript_27312/g.51773 Transcript_27312/m.51773 type:complete len:203 (-) Transcript_27312:639-1247(-)
MNSKANLLVHLLQLCDDARERELRLGDRQSVPGHDDDRFGLLDRLNERVDAGSRHLPFVDLGLAVSHASARRRACTSKDNGDDAAVHRLAHDPRQDRPRETNQRPDLGQERLLKHEAFCDQRPTGVRVKHRNHDRHVRPPNARDQIQPQTGRYESDSSEGREPDSLGVRRDRSGQSGVQKRRQASATHRERRQVDCVPSRKR